MFVPNVRGPTGYGLSYTTFEYANLKLSAPRFDRKLVASVEVKNTGKVAGREVAQLYLRAPAKSLDKSAKELKGLAKTQRLPCCRWPAPLWRIRRCGSPGKARRPSTCSAPSTY